MLAIGAAGVLASLTCLVWGIRLSDDIWHARRARGRALLLAALVIFALALGLILLDPSGAVRNLLQG